MLVAACPFQSAPAPVSASVDIRSKEPNVEHCHVAFASSLNESVAKSSRLWNMTQRGLMLPARMLSL